MPLKRKMGKLFLTWLGIFVLAFILLHTSLQAEAADLVIRPLKGEDMNLEVSLSETVSELKARIEENFGYPAGEQVLFFKGSQLSDEKRLSQCDIKQESVIELVETPTDQCTVSFSCGEGSEIAPKTVLVGKRVSKPSPPLREGYLFEGWYTDEDLKTPYNFDEPVMGDMVLFAKYLREVRIKSGTTLLIRGDTFEVDENTAMVLESGVELDNQGTIVNKGRIYNYSTLTGKIQNSGKIYHFGDIADTAEIDGSGQIFQSVVFDFNGGSGSVSSLTVEDGHTVSRPDSPVREGYLFSGWYLQQMGEESKSLWHFDTDPVTRPVVLVAGWIPRQDSTLSQRESSRSLDVEKTA